MDEAYAVIVGLTSRWSYPGSAGTPVLSATGWVGTPCNPYYHSASLWVSLLTNMKLKNLLSVPDQ